jgi:hypothetical protein
MPLLSFAVVNLAIFSGTAGVENRRGTSCYPASAEWLPPACYSFVKVRRPSRFHRFYRFQSLSSVDL